MTGKAKLFMHGRSQAVRLPKEFRLPGTEVRISRDGDSVILKPLEPEPFDAKAWLARLDAYGDVAFPGAVSDPVLTPNDDIRFD